MELNNSAHKNDSHKIDSFLNATFKTAFARELHFPGWQRRWPEFLPPILRFRFRRPKIDRLLKIVRSSKTTREKGRTAWPLERSSSKTPKRRFGHTAAEKTKNKLILK